MLIAAAVCPHPPLLVPELAGGAAAELDDLRAACTAAVRRLVATGAPLHVVAAVGSDAVRATSLLPWGVAAARAEEPLPLPFLVAEWLLRHCGGRATARHEVAPDASRDDCAALGAGIAAAGDVALLVMGDASARRSEKAPGWVDERSEAYDVAAAAALRAGDPAALLALDERLGAELLAAGRAAWQVLAGAAGKVVPRAEVSYDAAPYGVGYLVATWE